MPEFAYKHGQSWRAEMSCLEALNNGGLFVDRSLAIQFATQKDSRDTRPHPWNWRSGSGGCRSCLLGNFASTPWFCRPKRSLRSPGSPACLGAIHCSEHLNSGYRLALMPPSPFISRTRFGTPLKRHAPQRGVEVADPCSILVIPQRLPWRILAPYAPCFRCVLGIGSNPTGTNAHDLKHGANKRLQANPQLLDDWHCATASSASGLSFPTVQPGRLVMPRTFWAHFGWAPGQPPSFELDNFGCERYIPKHLEVDSSLVSRTTLPAICLPLHRVRQFRRGTENRTIPAAPVRHSQILKKSESTVPGRDGPVGLVTDKISIGISQLVSKHL